MKRTIPKKKTTRRCGLKSCKKDFTPQRDGQYVCSYECSIKYTAQNKAEAEYKANKEWAVKKKAWGEDLKTHSEWSKELQIEINTIARLIDKDSLCVSSLTKLNDKFDAGHRFSVGAFPQLRFNLLNIHAQSVHQNQYLSGNPDGYDHGLSCLYGDDYLQEVHDLRTKYKTLKLSIPELIQAKKRAKKIVARLKKADLTYTNEQRIELRKQMNSDIGIYN